MQYQPRCRNVCVKNPSGAALFLGYLSLTLVVSIFAGLARHNGANGEMTRRKRPLLIHLMNRVDFAMILRATQVTHSTKKKKISNIIERKWRSVVLEGVRVRPTRCGDCRFLLLRLGRDIHEKVGRRYFRTSRFPKSQRSLQTMLLKVSARLSTLWPQSSRLRARRIS